MIHKLTIQAQTTPVAGNYGTDHGIRCGAVVADLPSGKLPGRPWRERQPPGSAS